MNLKPLLPGLALVLAACGDVKNPNGMPDESTSNASARIVTANPPKPDSAAAKTENPVMPADTSVTGAWLILDGALRSHDAQVLNQLMDPEYGLWILEQAGGTPRVTRVADVQQFRDQQQQPLFALDKKLMTCAAPQPVAALPSASCPGGKFGQEGCFVGPSTAFRGLDFWAQASVKGGNRNQGQAAQGRTVRSVLQTRTGYQFHFAKSAGVGGRWRLIFVDLRGACPS
ncbi:hypothetical protein GCM10011375_15970 [Hymenobacter qilianensis]|uniref:Uncharacterized protein n=2 Tax=Hymenobacter qilianensis TaxID=1385715 RepID=A0ACB5PQE2_9BACT|nr:hypothetical protein [Hymenobacter qilianensis]QNP51809.1 hypothetical protein H9L05_17950 [Hymenobacter qilianensis]GGF61723.1 hypothetical protein GCM10011375_15970 [Hymenobacter qilianensis]